VRESVCAIFQSKDAGERAPAEVRVEIPLYGRIHWYRPSGDFEAFCACGHRRCTKKRRSTADTRGLNPAQGRPLAFLLAWLEAGWGRDRDGHQGYKPSKAQRKRARRRLPTIPGFWALAREGARPTRWIRL
jgi:hypothetical protein